MKTSHKIFLIVLTSASAQALPAPDATGVPTKLPAKAKATPAPTPEIPQASAAPVVQSKSITKAVGEVRDHFVTSREVRIADAVEQALTGKPTSPEGFSILSGSEPSFSGDVAQVLDEWMVWFEAQGLSTQAPSKTEVTRVIRLVQEKWGSDSAWKALEVSNDELNDMVIRKLAVKEFVRMRGDPELAPVTDEEAENYYKKNRLRFGSLPFANFKDSIKSYLVKTQTERRLREWHEVLRRKYKSRNFISN